MAAQSHNGTCGADRPAGPNPFRRGHHRHGKPDPRRPSARGKTPVFPRNVHRTALVAPTSRPRHLFVHPRTARRFARRTRANPVVDLRIRRQPSRLSPCDLPFLARGTSRFRTPCATQRTWPAMLPPRNPLPAPKPRTQPRRAPHHGTTGHRTTLRTPQTPRRTLPQRIPRPRCPCPRPHHPHPPGRTRYSSHRPFRR